MPAGGSTQVLRLYYKANELAVPVTGSKCGVDKISCATSVLGHTGRGTSRTKLGVGFVRTSVEALGLRRGFSLVFLPFGSVRRLCGGRSLFRMLGIMQGRLGRGNLFLLSYFGPGVQCVIRGRGRRRMVTRCEAGSKEGMLVRRDVCCRGAARVGHVG